MVPFCWETHSGQHRRSPYDILCFAVIESTQRVIAAGPTKWPRINHTIPAGQLSWALPTTGLCGGRIGAFALSFDGRTVTTGARTFYRLNRLILNAPAFDAVGFGLGF